MSCYQAMLQAVTFRFHDRIKKACYCLFNSLSLNEFWYYKVTDSGYMIYLGSHPEWCEYYAAEKLYFDSPYYRHPRFFRDGISIIKVIPHRPLSRILESGSRKFGIYNSLLLLKKITNGIEGFGFSSSSGDELQLTMLLNELPLLRLFTKKFRKDNQFLFRLLEDNQADVAKVIGPAFEETVSVMPQHSENQTLLSELGVSHPLSSREKDVIKWLKDGYSAKQIGLKLFLSKRTVEHHVERMKEKLGCESKAELVQKARELEHWDWGYDVL